jgi:hypothetical protein
MFDMLARNFLRNAAVGMKCGFLEVPFIEVSFTETLPIAMLVTRQTLV